MEAAKATKSARKRSYGYGDSNQECLKQILSKEMKEAFKIRKQQKASDEESHEANWVSVLSRKRNYQSEKQQMVVIDSNLDASKPNG